MIRAGALHLQRTMSPPTNNVTTDSLEPTTVDKINHSLSLTYLCAISNKASAIAFRAISLVPDEHHITRLAVLIFDGSNGFLCPIDIAAFAAVKRIAFDRCVVDARHQASL
ncbi:hypothetical protein BN2475_460002 [Paraburkholderia ribeironis]|uniref:Uncharacterized protein n=1 Tax=Paraburkholderia ribeironis TaxID=1247936 RepID=A0A1N7S9J3_9BURK|nr:hypothetical protein BN2475_460002 [Paraburkholderia ribeironis]